MFCGMLVLTATGIAPAGDLPSAKRCLVVAHRGFSKIAPESTLVAAAKAVEAGADGSEFDIYPSSDGILVVMHNPTVDKTTDRTGKVTDLSLAEIKKLDAGVWKDPQFAGERVPTLDEMLALLRLTPCKPVIEIKADGITDEVAVDVARKVVAAVRSARMVDRAYVISFHRDAVKTVRMLEPRLPCALLCNIKQMPAGLSPDESVDWLAKAAAECRTDFLDLHNSLLTADIVAKLHRQKLTVWTYTVDDQETMDKLIGWEVDGITTDCPDLLKSRVDEAAREHK